jgi:putative membrane protein
MMVIMVVFWVAVIAALVWSVPRFRTDRSEPAARRRSTADEILAERFARGEIDQEEFIRARQSLHTDSHA